MEKETIKVSKQSAIMAYNKAKACNDSAIMAFLKDLFGEDTFKDEEKDNVTERVKTFEDACEELGGSHPLVIKYKNILENADLWEENLYDIIGYDAVAYLKLRIICAALNEGWEPQFTETEERYYPYHYLLSKADMNETKNNERYLELMPTYRRRTGYAAIVCATKSSGVPAGNFIEFPFCFCMKNDTLAKYCGKQFIHLWIDLLLPREKEIDY